VNYLVTGGAGFIGSHLCDALIKRGDSVVVLDDLSTGKASNINHLVKKNSFKMIEGSILDESMTEKLIKSVDQVLHFAAAVGVLTIVDNALNSLILNIKGTENILKFASKHSKQVLLASTSEIYGKNTQVPLSEDSDRVIGSPLKSRWSYSEAKAVDESLAYFYHVESGLPIRIVRLFNTVGPRQVGTYGMVVPRFISAALTNEPIKVYGTGEQTRCFCHVEDAVIGILAVLDSQESVGQVFNIGNNQEISINELARQVLKIADSKSEIQRIPYQEAYSNGFEDMQRRVPDISKIKRILGWEPKLDLNKIITDIIIFQNQ
jgi:UDP-glucose 4-epimerase